MKILVCVKQVPETNSIVKIDGSKKWVEADMHSAFRTSRFDEYAVEEALRIREAVPGAVVDAITAGPDRAKEVLRRAMGMGADGGIHILTDDRGYVSPFTTAARIAAVAGKRKYDLILTGIMSEDEAQGQVGPMVAEMLGLPCATAVVSLKISSGSRPVYVEREIEGGCRDCLEIRLPALLTVQAGINRPRYPSLSNVMRANKAELKIFDAGGLAVDGGRQRAAGAEAARRTRDALFLEGTREEKAAELLKILKEKQLVKTSK
ncbi:MAG: electron transfer flavoprotein subunit beta/FixA family protein [bacterium]